MELALQQGMGHGTSVVLRDCLACARLGQQVPDPGDSPRAGEEHLIFLRPLGDIALPLVKRELDRIFAYRTEAVRRILLETAPEVAA